MFKNLPTNVFSIRLEWLIVLGFFFGNSFSEDNVSLRLNSSAWFQFGRVMHSSDTLNPGNNYNGNWIQSPGAQFTVEADIADNMQGAMGFGGYQTQNQSGTIINSQNQSIGFKRYVTEARFSYFIHERKNPLLKIDAGLFPYNYNRNIKNLGLYLFRGPVYPGFLISEFESKTIDTTVSNILGINVQNNLGAFSQNLIFRSENEKEFRGNFDFSLAYLANYKFGQIVEIGAGINFYRLIPINSDFTQIKDPNAYNFNRESDSKPALENNYWYFDKDTLLAPDGITVDTVLVDTVKLTHQGTKLMGHVSFDPKPLIGLDDWNPNDLKLYIETALIGVTNYTGIYESRSERMPIVFGINFPTFGFLDYLTLEIELYKSPYRNDYKKLFDDGKNSPIPVSNKDYGREIDPMDSTNTYLNYDPVGPDSTFLFADYDVENMSSDDLKWSIYLRKTFLNNAIISAQIANDHYRPAQYENDPSRFETAFTQVKDWYLMFKVGYLF